MGGACAVIAAILAWRGSPWLVLPGIVGILLVAAAVVRPAALAPLETGWMALARLLGVVSTTVLLTAAYAVLLVPLALLLRLVGKDLLALRRHPERTTYWVAVERRGTGEDLTRPF